MPHIELPPNLPGIVGPITQYPETGDLLNALAEALLRGPSSLTPGERETIAAYVSSRNECTFCTETHSSVARHLLGDRAEIVDQVRASGDRALVGPKLQTLLAIADKVREDGRSVTVEDIADARAAGADDKAIHDTVLIAAAFCMFNRYVDGLATWAPLEPEAYVDHGKALAETGYVRSIR
ncbi:carboxymuconolactone decarboxylase family protein [Micromonospora sp. NPDC007271]|uniref:carboxymuconolactone decarboxylase family protein n=1 Tax=Micromonospora sp. NPDC007271 TaxID=3154587 RepID=UPI0033F616B4